MKKKSSSIVVDRRIPHHSKAITKSVDTLRIIFSYLDDINEIKNLELLSKRVYTKVVPFVLELNEFGSL